jgi:hypothetical protein
VIATFHGRLDLPYAAAILAKPPAGLVAISRAQAAARPDVPWAGIVHNGLQLDSAPTGLARGDALCFVGRIAPEKGVIDAIDIAKRAGRPLRIAAKEPWTQREQQYFHEVYEPAARNADVELLGEIAGPERDRLFATSHATLMPGKWPEPFGLVAIESLACGTPVLARPAGALPEIIRPGVDGFFADDPAALAGLVDAAGGLDHDEIRRSVIERFSVGRMTDGYEAIYRRALARGPSASDLVVDENRQAEPEFGAAGWPRLGPDPATHRLDERATDEQADSRAGRLGGRGGRAVIELEKPADLRARDARTLIEDSDVDLILEDFGDDVDGRLVGGVLGGVADQVSDDLLDVGGVGGDRGHRSGHR